MRPVSPTMIRLNLTLYTLPNTMFLQVQQVAHHPHRQKIGCNKSILTFLINSWVLAVICGCSWKVLLCFRLPVCAVCMNHEVVVSQTRTGNSPDLGSVANYTFYSNSPAPPVSTGFMDISIHPLYPTAYRSVAFLLVAPLSCTHFPPTLLAQSAVHLDCSQVPVSPWRVLSHCGSLRTFLTLPRTS